MADTKTIRVNLLRREERRRPAAAGGGPRFTMPRLPSIGGGAAYKGALGLLIIVIVGIVAWGLLAWQARNSLDAEVRTLEAKNADLQRQLAEVRALEAAKREIQRRIDIIGRVAKSQGVPVTMMNGVLRAVPDGLWLTSMTMVTNELKRQVAPAPQPIAVSSETLAKLEEKKREGQETVPGTRPGPGQPKPRDVTEVEGYTLVIRGAAFTKLRLVEFMENLKKTGSFGDVDFSATLGANFEGVPVMAFELAADVKL